MPEEKMLEKVRKLLDRANHPNTPEGERNACLAKADAMMLKHAIDEAMLDASRSPEDRRTPIKSEIKAWSPSEWSSRFRTILAEICRTSRVRLATSWSGDVVLIGMSDDVAYVEMLWTSIYLHFLQRLDPKWDSSLGLDENVYNFKVAGKAWPAIHTAAIAHDHDIPWPDGGRLIRAYRRRCKVLDVQPTNHTQRHGAYRESFADAYTFRVCARLEDLRNEQEAATDSGAGLVLYDASQLVEQMFYDLYPEASPEAREKRLEEAQANAKAEEEARAAMLERMTPKQRAAFLDKEERQRQRDAAADDRYWAQRAARREGSGSAAGRKAGNEVRLSRESAVPEQRRAGELS